jgi:predicted nucleic acid-binding protein
MSDILVDTSVWVAHFQKHNKVLARLLHLGIVMSHPMVLGELACGMPPTRTLTLDNIGQLQTTKIASVQEVMAFINREKLYGLGYGLVDIMLLASTLMTPDTQLCTLDKRLHALTQQ